MLPGSVVKAGHRLATVVQPVNGHHHHLPDGVENGHDADIQITAVELEGGVAHHLDQAVGQVHEKAGQAQGHDPFCPCPVQADRAPAQAQAQDGPRPGEEQQHPPAGQALSDHSSQGGSLYAHIQPKNQDGVQRDVHCRTQHHRHHACAAKALGIDEGVHPQADGDEHSAAQVDGEVVVGVGEGVGAGPEQIEDGLLQHQEKGGGHRPQQQEQGEGVAHDVLRLPIVPPAPADGTQRRAAGAAQVGQPHQHRDNGGGHPDPGEGQVAASWQPTQVDAVHHAVEHIDQLGRCHRNSQREDIPRDASLGKIIVFARQNRSFLLANVLLLLLNTAFR